MNNHYLDELTLLLANKRLKVACAESCTGGLLASYLTAKPGSSEWIEMSFVTYSNEAKQQLLNVSSKTLELHGAVSKETVIEMAQGVIKQAHCDLALSISGIAGPSGGTPQKPVGTVWFGCAYRNNIIAHQQYFSGDRQQIRLQAVDYALKMLTEMIKSQPN